MKNRAGLEVSTSVIIVTYNSEREIGACLGSVMPQIRSVGGEVLVVDNASSDKTVDLVESIRIENSEIALIRNRDNLGFSRANNQALERAQGEFVLLLNPDTEVEDDALAKLIGVLRMDDSVGAVAPLLKFPDGRVQHSCRRFPTYGAVIWELLGLSRLFPHSRFLNGWKMGDFDHTFSREVDQPAAAALLIRGDLFRELGGFDPGFPMFFSDVDLCRRIWRRKKILFYPDAVAIHRGGASVKPRKTSMIVSSHRSFVRYFRKWHTGPFERVMNVLMAVLLYVAMGFRVVWAVVRPASVSSRRNAL